MRSTIARRSQLHPLNLSLISDPGNKTVPCYDRYLQGHPDSRDMLFLFPDKTIGLKVFSLPRFWELD